MAQITLKDVARQAGVSFKTVSRVINHEPNVSPETAEKVKDAIAELNYVPNSAARSLSRGKAMAIGLVTGWPANTPYTSALIENSLNESMYNGYSLALFAMGKGTAKKVIDAFLGRRVDGVILDTNAADDEEFSRQLNALSIPYVVIHPNRKNGHTRASFVRIDNVAAARQAVSYLIEIGHRCIGDITYRAGLNQESERLQGYYQALNDAGITVCDEWIFGESNTGVFQVGYNGAQYLIRNHPELTAIFTETDDIAIGVVGALWQMGLKIPDDISVIGFDDITYATMVTPPLTTIHQPISEIASTAVRHLIQTIDNPLTAPIDMVLPTHLVIRDTCKPPRLEPSLIPVR
jgi:DNA-binding LacI/PurR family transcriptional regulator